VFLQPGGPVGHGDLQTYQGFLVEVFFSGHFREFKGHRLYGTPAEDMKGIPMGRP
jgi:hypothetical protein